MAFNAGSIFVTLKANIKEFKDGLANAQKSTGEFKGKLDGLSSTAKEVGKILGIAIGGKLLVDGIKGAVNAAIQMENALIGLSSVARAMGVNVDDATDAAKALAADGLMSVNEAAEGLKNLLATGFSLPQAINLMNSFRDAAAFNRQGTLAFGEAIVGATQGIKNQNSIMVDNVGITKNLSVIMKEAGLSIDALQNVTSDASVRQKLYNGLLKEASIFQGDAARAADTMGGRLSQVRAKMFELSASIGEALSPLILDLADIMLGVLGPAADWVSNHMLEIKAVAISVSTALQILGAIIVGVFGAIAGALTLNFGKARDSVYDMLGNINNKFGQAETKMQQMAEKSYSRQTAAAQKSFDNQVKGNDKKGQQIAKQLEKETEKFEREMAKRKKSFEENLADLIRAHIDKADSLKEDISDENEDFDQRMKDRKRDFEETLAEMADDHQDKVDDIKTQIEEETAKGEEANQKTLQDLEARLAKENLDYDESVQKAKTRQAEEDARIQAEHQKRLDDLNQRLKAEEDILNKHQEDVAAVKEQAREDDIDRLKRQFEEENKEATEEHARRMDEIAERGEQLGNTLGTNIDSALGAVGPDIQATMSEIGKNSAEELQKNIANGAREAGRQLVSNFIQGIRQKVEEGLAVVGVEIFKMSPALQAIASGIDASKNFLRNFDNGGIVPGVSGEPRMIIAHAGERIIPRGEVAKTTGGNIINIDLAGAFIGSGYEADMLGRRVGDSIIRQLQMNVGV